MEKKKIQNPFAALNKFEWSLWLSSLVVVTLSFLLSPDKDYLSLCASLIGVTALIFVAKGMVIGQILCVIFAVFYGIVSFYFRYFGEMITYLGMSAPIAIFSVISWLRHPYKQSQEVEVNQVTKKQWLLLSVVSVAVTIAFYFVLRALHTTNLLISTISVTTSFVACYLSFLRSAFYAVGYAANDVVLIVLWTLAAIENIAYLPMIACFVAFLANDGYGFYQWQKMKRRQRK